MKKWLIIPLVLLFVAFIAPFLYKYRLTETGGVSGSTVVQGNINIVAAVETHFGKAVMFEETDRHQFGVTPLVKTGPFWSAGGITHGNYIEEGAPFKATGIGNSNEAHKEQFIVGVKTADPNIAFVTTGNHLPSPSPYVPYNLSLEEVRQHPAEYKISDVHNGYALFVWDDYTENSWIVHAFDKNGNLIADKLTGSQARYINK